MAHRVVDLPTRAYAEKLAEVLRANGFPRAVSVGDAVELPSTPVAFEAVERLHLMTTAFLAGVRVAIEERD